jgi:hypothetical protein
MTNGLRNAIHLLESIYPKYNLDEFICLLMNMLYKGI